MSIVTIATDFGTADGYVAAVKGVIKSIAPDSELIDVTHDLDSIVKSSLVIIRYYSLYPTGTVHLMVVDPTVGSDRKALIGHDGNYYYVGPDNGIFSRIIAACPDLRWWIIDQTKVKQGEISATFHGRDIFAPAAAMIAKGISPDKIGKRIKNPISLELPEPKSIENGIEGEIIDIDKFGNLIANISGEMIRGDVTIFPGEKESLSLVKTYSDVPQGKPLAYIGSLGYLEIGVNSGRADNYFRASIGDKVRVVV
ncbi:MAG: SAM-dependent chlorinase/fluorinase [candidate division Zixibacteria bacterium]